MILSGREIRILLLADANEFAQRLVQEGLSRDMILAWVRRMHELATHLPMEPVAPVAKQEKKEVTEEEPVQSRKGLH